MKLRRWIPGLLFLALAMAAAAGLVVTRDRAPPEAEASPAARRAGPVAPPRWRRIDTRPLLTAHRLAALAVTPEEKELARQAESLADHAVDLTFAEAMRQVAEEAPEQSPKVRALAEAKQKAQAAVAADEARLKRLAEELAGVRIAQRHFRHAQRRARCVQHHRLHGRRTINPIHRTCRHHRFSARA